jgi:hypothetical protein
MLNESLSHKDVCGMGKYEVAHGIISCGNGGRCEVNFTPRLFTQGGPGCRTRNLPKQSFILVTRTV